MGRNRSARYPAYQPAGEPSTWTRRLDRIRGPSVVRAPPNSRLAFGTNPTHGTAEEVDITDSANLATATPTTANPATADPATVDSAIANPATDIEMGPIPSQEGLALDVLQPPPEIARRGTTARRAWRRERIASLHAREYTQQEEEARMEDQRRPLCKFHLSLSQTILTNTGRRVLGLA